MNHGSECFATTCVYTFASPEPWRNCMLVWVVIVSVSSIATSGCRGLSSQALRTPGCFVCLRGFVEWLALARPSPPLLGRSRPRFRSPKAAGATAPAPLGGALTCASTPAPTSPLGLGKSLCPPTSAVVVFVGCVCFPPNGSGPAEHTRSVPNARSFPTGTPPCVRACDRVPTSRPRTGHP